MKCCAFSTSTACASSAELITTAGNGPIDVRQMSPNSFISRICHAIRWFRNAMSWPSAKPGTFGIFTGSPMRASLYR
jgi:hypothetical protein